MFPPPTLALSTPAVPFGLTLTTEIAGGLLLTLGLGGLLAWLFLGANRAVAELRRSAFLDPLTGLGNRRAFEAALAKAWTSRRDGLVVVRFDLGGLGTEDELPRTVADALRMGLDPGAAAFRVGVREYAVLCSAGSSAAVEATIRTALTHGQQVGILEPNLGSAAATEVSSSEALVRLAEERLFPEKRVRPQDRPRMRA